MALWWDDDEPQLLAIEMKSLHTSEESTATVKQGTGDTSKLERDMQYIRTDVWIIFYSDKNELSVLEAMSLNHNEQLLGLCLPNIVSYLCLQQIFIL